MNLSELEMQLFDSLPKEHRDLINEYNCLWDVHEYYSLNLNVKEIERKLEDMRYLMQQSQLQELVRRARNMKTNS